MLVSGFWGIVLLRMSFWLLGYVIDDDVVDDDAVVIVMKGLE